jgi:hypothetical protein
MNLLRIPDAQAIAPATVFLPNRECPGGASTFMPWTLAREMPGSTIPGRGEDCVEDIEETFEDDDLDDDTDDTEDAEPEAPGTPAAPATGDEDVESIQDMLVKQEARDEAEEEDDSVLNLTREERLEPLAVKVVPPQPTEFICKKCYLVKHRSQLKDKAKMLCRDCA